MLRLKTSRILVDFKGNPIKAEDGNPALLGRIISNVLAGKTSNPTRSWVLGKKFATEKFVDLLAEDVVFLKAELQALSTSPEGWMNSLLCGQILEILDSEGDKDESNPTKKTK